MRLERLTTPEHPMYPQARELYALSFPFHEQREDASQRQIMGRSDYQFHLIYDQNLFTGLLLCWETADFIYVEHFCIRPDLRNQKYGQRTLELLLRRGKTVILEIDPPVDAIAQRRKGFYQRLGFQANPYPHIHPPYHTGCSGHPLVVMSCPALLTEEEYHGFDRYLKDMVMDGAHSAP